MYVGRVSASQGRSRSRSKVVAQVAAGAVCASAAVVGVAAAAEQPVAAGQHVAAAAKRPNIVLVTTDDMSLTDLRWMPQTRKLIARRGASVTRFISNHPVCCPARAAILTGQHAQNHGVRHNTGPGGGYQALLDKDNHVGTWLRDAGYRTALVGKHLNGWEATRERQAGWTKFNPILRGTYNPYDITMYDNGTPRTYTKTHTSDLMGRITTRYVRAFSRGKAPFFIWTSQVAPHGMRDSSGKWGFPKPAARHRSLYGGVMPPSFADPAYGEDDVSDKPPHVQASTTMGPTRTINLHRARIRSLRSVDDQVKALVTALRETGELANTYIFFTSDNGLLMGEHRQSSVKNQVYDPAVRVPLVARGPGIPAGVARPAMYSMADLAPTFLQIGQAEPGRVLDGRSMLPTLRRGAPGYDHYLTQAGEADRTWWWRGVRSADYVFARYDDGFEELYDMRADPHQLSNVAHDPAYADVRAEYAARTQRLSSCSGATCLTGGAPQAPASP